MKLGKSILDAAEKEATEAAKRFDDKELAEKAKSIPPLRKSLATLAPPPPPPTPPGWSQPQLGAGGGAMRKPSVAPVSAAPAAPPPRPAPIVMSTQAAAMKDIQGN